MNSLPLFGLSVLMSFVAHAHSGIRVRHTDHTLIDQIGYSR
jgi:hypothetical protein